MFEIRKSKMSFWTKFENLNLKLNFVLKFILPNPGTIRSGTSPRLSQIIDLSLPQVIISRLRLV